MAVNIKTHLGHVANACMQMLKVHADSLSLKRRAYQYSIIVYVKSDPPCLHYKYAPVAADVLQRGEVIFTGQMIKLIF
mgnify:FL=1